MLLSPQRNLLRLILFSNISVIQQSNHSNISINFRLFLLELTKGNGVSESTEMFSELTSSNVQIPFNFGNIDWSGKIGET